MPLKTVLAAASALAVIGATGATFGATGAMFGATGTMFGATGAAFAAETVRIEPRAYYGATVTMEEGVRVFRPLPPHRRVIINPGGKTPLSLGFEDKRSVSHSYNYNYVPDSGSYYGGGGSGVSGLPFGFSPK